MRSSSLNDNNSFAIVGIGMHNWDPKLLQKFFSHIPADLNSAYIVVLHSNHEQLSHTISALSRTTSMKITAIRESDKIRPDTIFLTTIDNRLYLENNIFKFDKISQNIFPSLTIDIFFKSLAHYARDRAIGILLSGFDCNCLNGFRSITDNCGLTIINNDIEPDQIQHDDSIALNAIADFHLPLAAIPQKLVFFIKHPYFFSLFTNLESSQELQKNIIEIAQIIKHHTGHDFFYYKFDTIFRMISKRMVIDNIEKLADYKNKLMTDHNEIELLFHEIASSTIDITQVGPASSPDIDLRISTLEKELICTKEYLKSTIDSLEHINEDLQSANEELTSINEEFRTSQEELQSANEELLALNTELHNKVNELFQANCDINNMFASTNIGTLFLDINLCIRRYTPAISNFINIIPGDIGRPLRDLNLKFDFDNLLCDIGKTLNTEQSRETSFCINNNKWYSLKIMPYKSLTGDIDGVVLTFVDITEVKLHEISKNRQSELINLSHDAIMVCDMKDKIIFWNQGSTVNYGWTQEEAIGKASNHLLKTKYPISKNTFKENLLRHGRWNGELVQTIKDGSKKTMSSRWSVQYNDNGEPIAFLKINHDVSLEKMMKLELNNSNKKLEQLVKKRTAELENINIKLKLEIEERRQTENELKQSITEKEILLREIYHRTKNNMQVISSLLALQSKQITSDSEELIPIFQDLTGRIKAMSLVHEKLYQTKDLSRINLNEYTMDLIHILTQTYTINRHDISIKTHCEDIFVSIDTAIPYGLIVNELISNSLKHAFPDNRKGIITVSLRQSQKKMITLTIADNGIGFPKKIKLEKTSSLGLTLFRQIATYQLQGKITIKTKPAIAKGSEFSIHFKEIPYQRRI